MSEKLKRRDEISEHDKWKIEDLFESDSLWQDEYDNVVSQIDIFVKFKGKLRESQQLINCLEARDRISKSVQKLYVYANMKLHQDSTNSKYQTLSDKASSIFTEVSKTISFIESEVLEMEDKELENIIKSDDRFEIYEHYLEDVTRIRKHILTSELEELLSSTRNIANVPQNIYSMITNADIKFGVVLDDDGKEVALTHARYNSLIRSKSQSVRRQAFKTYYESYIKQKYTLATTYSASVKADLFFTKSKKYKSSLERALFNYNIPNEVYRNLISVVNGNLNLMHRYVALKKKMLKLSEIHIYDLLADTSSISVDVPYHHAKQQVIESVKILGAEYASKVEYGFNNGWVDVYENVGKRSGAYSWGAYGTHPYILMNYNNKMADMFTLAHEMGHAMHSYNSWKTQPYIYSDYSIFLAEVASTVNESLLMDYLLNNSEDSKEKEYLLNHYLDQFRGTLFRQAMFAEFEMITHEMVENDEVLTVDSLCAVYRNLNIKYYGKDIIMDSEIDMEWSRIPHFYDAFYVYQYATGFSSAIALSKKILSKEKGSIEAYTKFLESGSSDYPINVLKAAGVDLTSKETIENAMSVFKELLEKMENMM